MLAKDIIKNFASRGITLSLDGDQVKAHPTSALTDNDHHLLKCYRAELLWRLRHPDGDPLASGYLADVCIDGMVVPMPLSQLIAEGLEIVEREGLEPNTPNIDRELWAASVALGRYNEAHRQRAEGGVK